MTPKPAEASPATPRRLEEILRALPPAELSALVHRLGIRIDPAKRIDPPAQVARVLVGQPEVRDPSRLPTSSRELLHRIAESRGVLATPSIPAGLDVLLGRGLVYARRAPGGLVLVLPSAFLVQLKTWEGEDPRCLRALLAQAPFETLSAVAAHHLGRPATPPISLALEVAWEKLSDSALLAEELERLAPVERRLLEAIDRVGGEVDTEELLDLEREPLRLRTATGVTTTRRGAGFALERRGMLIPIHPNRHAIPTEVSLLVGAERKKEREARRAEIRSLVVEEDHVPRRARFAADPGSTALALALAIRESGASEVRAGVGTPRSLVFRLATRFGKEADTAGLLAGLSRAVGLWDPSALSPATPPGSLTLAELGFVLFSTWQKGGAWDEARPDPELFRVAAESRDASPIGGLRHMVLAALQDLGEGRWVPWASLEGYLAADERVQGAERLLRRWAERGGHEAPSPLEVARRMALESLPALGVVDLGLEEGAPETARGEGVSLRLTPRGRAYLAGGPWLGEPEGSSFVDAGTLRLGSTTSVAAVLPLASAVEVGRIDGALELSVSAATVGRAVAAGVPGDAIRARLEALAALPEPLARALDQISTILGRATFVQTAGFLWIDDPDLREMLRTRKGAADLFVDPSPPGGLLIAPEVEPDRLARRCRALGVEVAVEGGALKARSEASESGSPRRPPSSGRMRAAKGR